MRNEGVQGDCQTHRAEWAVDVFLPGVPEIGDVTDDRQVIVSPYAESLQVLSWGLSLTLLFEFLRISDLPVQRPELSFRLRGATDDARVTWTSRTGG